MLVTYNYVFVIFTHVALYEWRSNYSKPLVWRVVHTILKLYETTRLTMETGIYIYSSNSCIKLNRHRNTWFSKYANKRTDGWTVTLYSLFTWVLVIRVDTSPAYVPCTREPTQSLHSVRAILLLVIPLGNDIKAWLRTNSGLTDVWEDTFHIRCDTHWSKTGRVRREYSNQKKTILIFRQCIIYSRFVTSISFPIKLNDLFSHIQFDYMDTIIVTWVEYWTQNVGSMDADISVRLS